MPLYSSKPKSPDKVSRSKVNTDLSDVVPPIKKSGKQPNAIRPEAIKQLIKKGHRPQLPPMLKPMMASLANESFSDPGWLFELKYDGYRAMALIQRGRLNCFQGIIFHISLSSFRSLKHYNDGQLTLSSMGR